MNKFKKEMKNSPDYQTVIKSGKDSEIFFNSIVIGSEPNADLVVAARRFKELWTWITG